MLLLLLERFVSTYMECEMPCRNVSEYIGHVTSYDKTDKEKEANIIVVIKKKYNV